MDETMLNLKPGVTPTERDGQIGLTLHGRAQFAKDARQAQILRALILQSRPPESLMAFLQTRVGSPENDNEISLAIAEFILDFGEYLEE